MRYTLWAVCQSNGDGSSSLRLFSNEKRANEYADELPENSRDDVNRIYLKVEDGKLFYMDYDDEYEDFWVELKANQ